MITHVVLFKWKPDVEAGHAERVAEGLRSLSGLVPSVRRLECGSDIGVREGNFDFGVAVRFDDAQGYLDYVAHPDHVRVANELIFPFIGDRAAVQFEG